LAVFFLFLQWSLVFFFGCYYYALFADIIYVLPSFVIKFWQCHYHVLKAAYYNDIIFNNYI